MAAATLVSTSLFAQQKGAIQPPASTAEQLPPIAAAEIPAQAEKSRAYVRDLLLLLQKQEGIKEIKSHIPETRQRLEEAALETEAMLAARPSRDVLEESLSQWSGELSRSKKLREQIEGYANQLGPQLAQLQAQIGLWRLTASEARRTKMPAPLLERVTATLKAMEDAGRQASEQQGELLGVLDQLAELQAACEHNLEAISAAERSGLVSFDSPPLWTALLQGEAGTELTARIQGTLEKQRAALARYLKSESRRLVAQVAFFFAVLFVLSLLKRRTRRWENGEQFSSTAARVLGRPASAALLLMLALTGMFHPHAPRALRSLALLLVVIPLLRLLQGLYQMRVRYAIYLLAFFFLLDHAVEIISYRTLAGRLLLLLLAFLLWVALAIGIQVTRRKVGAARGWRLVLGLAQVLSAAVLFSMVANVIGSVALASLLTDGTLTALYLAVVLQAAVLVLRGVFAALARTNALSALRMISRHGPLVQQRLDRGLIWLAAIGWVLGTLAGFSVIRPFFQYARIVLAKPLEVGHLSVSLGDILGFVLVIWLSILVSRFLRFFLEEEVFVRVRLARGVPGTVSRLTHYSVIALGFMVALSASGFGLDRLTVLAGAFGVGVGFGLQDVVKNFVSGLILLFERPIKIGDQIEFGGMSGEVTGIGIRASTLRNYEGADVIVPNGTLLAGQLTNWTYASAPRRMEITVGVAYGTEPKQVLELLLRVASEHADICKTPAPMALFVGFGDSALNFSLRAWTARTDRYLGIKSELTAAVNATLNQAGIEMPFPQRDLHLRSVDPAVRKLL